MTTTSEPSFGPHSLSYVAPPDPLRCVHLDGSLLVVDKPAGLLSVPGRGPERDDCAARRALAWAEDALTVHRLDMGTSGLLVFARGAAVQRELSGAFMRREVHKRYVGVVHGELQGEAGEVALPLSVDWPRRPRQQVDLQRGKPALTRWWVTERLPGRTRLALEPVTGRSHQLRVHLAALGHPLVGDALYGPEPPEGPRLLLHAQALGLRHPGTGLWTEWAVAPPF